VGIDPANAMRTLLKQVVDSSTKCPSLYQGNSSMTLLLLHTKRTRRKMNFRWWCHTKRTVQGRIIKVQPDNNVRRVSPDSLPLAHRETGATGPPLQSAPMRDVHGMQHRSVDPPDAWPDTWHSSHIARQQASLAGDHTWGEMHMNGHILT
jgi:hypothetical protein